MRNDLPISPKKKFKYSITFQSFDEESLEAGDSFDSGYEIIDATDFIGDILYKEYFTYGIYKLFPDIYRFYKIIIICCYNRSYITSFIIIIF